MLNEEMGVIYETIEGRGSHAVFRVLSVENPNTKGSMIAIPGDITSCRIQGNLVYGEKISIEYNFANTALQNDLWEKQGFFIFDVGVFHQNLLNKDDLYETSLQFFNSESAMLKQLPPNKTKTNQKNK